MANKPIFAVILTLVGIMTLCVLVTKPIANHALAQHLLHFAATTPAPCSLTVSADPSSGSLAVAESIGSTISGKLTCGGTGLGGATIDLTGLSSSMSAKTDSSGNYDKGILVGAGQSLTVTAKFAGDSYHQAASATTSINIKEKNSGRFTPG